MKVLVVGGGGREHALAWKLKQSPRVSRLFCAPGNAGIAQCAELVNIPANDVSGLVRFAREQRIDLTVAGPELPLTMGLIDALQREGLRGFGPSAAAAQLEGSKDFSKAVMQRAGVPTATYASFTNADEAERYLDRTGAPIVVKADGLAAGKGVVVCATVAEAKGAINDIMRARVFGDAGSRIVIEEFLEGEEVSFMVLTDGTTVLPLASSQDHKRIGDGDRGPNTGGMGAYSPTPALPESEHERIVDMMMRPMIRGLADQGIVYRGVLYAGLMMTSAGPKVLEFNVRFGDPECQPLLMRLRSDLCELMWAASEANGLAHCRLEWDPRPAVCVVLAAGGYPGNYESGQEIRGLEALHDWQDGVVFHAGTASKDGRVVTNGGRVLGVTALGADLGRAIQECYRGVAAIEWQGMQFRRDIGRRGMERGS
jgi:phosphoribosylamine--glycine ligase